MSKLFSSHIEMWKRDLKIWFSDLKIGIWTAKFWFWNWQYKVSVFKVQNSEFWNMKSRFSRIIRDCVSAFINKERYRRVYTLVWHPVRGLSGQSQPAHTSSLDGKPFVEQQKMYSKINVFQCVTKLVSVLSVSTYVHATRIRPNKLQ